MSSTLTNFENTHIMCLCLVLAISFFVFVSQDAMEERLRRKAELQKQAAQPKTFGDSLKNEMQKQNQLKSQTKEERRNAMCEELGRGC
jgi:hypothetical protein